jgi:uncharacterized protein YacL
MKFTLYFIRVLFVTLSIVFMITYATVIVPGGLSWAHFAVGITSGLAFSLAIMSTESVMKKVNLRSLNIVTIGLFFGYLFGEGVYTLFNAVLDLSTLPVEKETLGLLKVALFLTCAFMGMVLSAQAADEIALQIPFIRFQSATEKRREILLDYSALLDPRIIDLASSGLLDSQLIVPRFLYRELQFLSESGEETAKLKAKKALQVLKTLESNPALGLRIVENDYLDIPDLNAKILKLARTLDCNILTADISRVDQAKIEGIRIINLHQLANGLKPITQQGEIMEIRIVGEGRQPKQGVGYLQDGTMVVVNGASEYIGQTVRAYVISVKHSPAGRLIFCNVLEEGISAYPQERIHPQMETHEGAKPFFMSENRYS